MPNALTEKYRPQTWADVVAQDKAVSLLRGLAESDTLGGRAIWISGKTGQGKTTLAWLTARAFGGEVRKINASKLTAEVLDEITHDFQALSTRLFGVIGKLAIVVEEAHSLKRGQIERLLTMLDDTPDHALWIFTTTKAGQKRWINARAARCGAARMVWHE